MSEGDKTLEVMFSKEAYDRLRSYLVSCNVNGTASGPLWELGDAISRAVEKNAKSLRLHSAGEPEPVYVGNNTGSITGG